MSPVRPLFSHQQAPVVKDWGAVSLDKVSLDSRLTNISTQFKAGECWHVLGQNGAGKSTLFDLISGLQRADAGAIDLTLMESKSKADDNLRLASIRSYLQQSYHLAFDLKSIELLQFYVEWPVDKWRNLDGSLCSGMIPDDLEHALSLQCLLEKPVNQLSGGELQRLQIGRILLQIWPALVNAKAFVFLDEPLQNLDVAFQAACLALLHRLAKRGVCVVMSVHDVNVPLQYATHVLMLKDGKIQAQGEVKELMQAESLSTLYDYPFNEFIDVNKSEKLFVKSPKAPPM